MRSFIVCAKVPEYEKDGWLYSHVELVALVDDEDYSNVIKHSWHARKVGNTFYPRARIGKKIVDLHHFILGMPPDGYKVDHKDRNGCNNQRDNLRFVTHRQNAQNTVGDTKTCIYPGVCFVAAKNKFKAQINIDGRQKYLGYSHSPEEAFLLYQKAVRELGQEVLDYE